MNGDDFLRFGQRLAGQFRNDPAGLRTAVSRCYYGVFHVAKKLLEELGFYPKGDNPHQFVQRCLQHSGDVSAQDAGNLLATLHEHRKNADYDIGNAKYESVRFVESAIIHATAIRARLQAFEAEPGRTALAAGVAAYWSNLSAKRVP